MSTEVILNATGARVYKPDTPPYAPSAVYTFGSYSDYIYTGFSALSDRFRVIEDVAIRLYPTDRTTYVECDVLSGIYSSSPPPTATYVGIVSLPANGSPVDLEINSTNRKNAVEYGMRFSPGLGSSQQAQIGDTVYTAASASYKPRLVVQMGALVGLHPTTLPASGATVDPTTSIRLRWSNTVEAEDGTIPLPSQYLETPWQTAVVITIREKASGTQIFQDVVTTSSTVYSYNLPANTLSADMLYEWKAEVTANSGATIGSGWKTLSTVEALPTAPTPTSPVGDVLDGSLPITFKWSSNYNEFDIRVSDDGSTWGAAINVQGEREYTMPANTFGAGTHYWQVRAYNYSGHEGNWSDATMFIVIASPEAPSVGIEAETPKPEILWEADGQQAYQVQIGDYYDTGLVFSQDTTFKSPVYIPDGYVDIRVRVMNQYNLWSEWTTVGATIQNTPGTAPTLTASVGSDVTLLWGTNGDYLVYRDSKMIAEVSGSSYTDRYSNGTVVYFVRQVLADDNYSDSNEVTVTLEVDHPMISSDGGQWIPLRYVTDAVHTIARSFSRNVDMTQYAYDDYPTAETSRFRTEFYQMVVAFKRDEVDALAMFEDLLGRDVFIKDQHGTAFGGVMSQMNKTSNQFYTVYTATIERTEGVL